MTALESQDELIGLWERDFVFALENVDPRVGRITAEQVFWTVQEDGSTERVYQEINLVDCKEFLPEGNKENEYSAN